MKDEKQEKIKQKRIEIALRVAAAKDFERYRKQRRGHGAYDIEIPSILRELQGERAVVPVLTGKNAEQLERALMQAKELLQVHRGKVVGVMVEFQNGTMVLVQPSRRRELSAVDMKWLMEGEEAGVCRHYVRVEALEELAACIGKMMRLRLPGFLRGRYKTYGAAGLKAFRKEMDKIKRRRKRITKGLP